MKNLAVSLLAGIVLLTWTGCSKDEPSPSTEVKPREAPTFAGAASQPSSAPGGALPAGHPPIAGSGMPAGHPAVGANTTAPAGEDAGTPLALQMPVDFQPKPARMMTLQVYAAPKAEGDPEDADVAVSALGARMPLKMNVDRWCGQFELPAGKNCENGVKQETLEGTKYATTMIEIVGTYKGSSMMGAPATPKPNYMMLTAEVVTPERPYYIKMVGPQKTVEKWRAAFTDAIKAAK